MKTMNLDPGAGPALVAVAALPAAPAHVGLKEGAERCGKAVLDWMKDNPSPISIFGLALFCTHGLWTSPPLSYVIMSVGMSITAGTVVWRCYRGPVKRPVERPKQD